MITYLHHTDPILPHYRKNKWNYPRGAAATVDRDFLGWHGRLFFHDVAHFHVIHHVRGLQSFFRHTFIPPMSSQFFPKIPFCEPSSITVALIAKIIPDNGEEATRYLKVFVGEHYNFSDKPVFRTLWDNYNNCQFVDNDGTFSTSRLAFWLDPQLYFDPDTNR